MEAGKSFTLHKKAVCATPLCSSYLT